MNKLILLIAIQFLVFSCSNSQDLDYAKKLDSCFDQNELTILNEACIAFEEQLTKQYSNLELEQAYLQYLKDLGEMKVHPSFFFSDKSKVALKKIKSSTVFDKIWINLDSVEFDNLFDELDYEIIPITGSNNEIEKTEPANEIELYCLNPKAEYFKCVSSSMTNSELIEYYKTIGQVPDISPSLKSSALGYSLKKKDFENDVLKLSVAIEFFIEMALMFPEN